MVELFGTKLEDKKHKIQPIETIVKQAHKKGIKTLEIPGKEATNYLKRLHKETDDHARQLARLIRVTQEVRTGSNTTEQPLTITLTGFPLMTYLQSNLATVEHYFEALNKDIMKEIEALKQLQTSKKQYKTIGFNKRFINELINEEANTYKEKGNWLEIKFPGTLRMQTRYFDPLIYDIEKPRMITKETHTDDDHVEFYGGIGYNIDEETLYTLLETIPADHTTYPQQKFPLKGPAEMLDFALDIAHDIKELTGNTKYGYVQPEKLKEEMSAINKGIKKIDAYQGHGADYIKAAFKKYFEEEND